MSNKSGLLLHLLFLLVSPALPYSLHAQTENLYELEQPDTTDFTPKSTRVVGYSDREVRERLREINGCVSPELTGVVKGYLNTYMFRKQDKTRRMLAKRLTYFPMFEQKLQEYGLPSDLKYLSVVESALNPIAVSSAGATGLWQFMPETGSEYGLRQSGQVEERSDPVKSTDAAMRYLKKLHSQFGDWALALAAYNSGPTRVNNAIKRAHSRNFWRIQNFLPKETANYVPAFIAASYICNFYQMHNIQPDDIDLDLQLTSYMRIWEGVSFRSIADATGLDYQVVKELNPGFRRDYVPAMMEGQYVVLPTRVMTAFANYLNTVSSQHNYIADLSSAYVTSDDGGDGRYAASLFKIEQTDHVNRVAMAISADGSHLKTWNNLASNWVPAGTMLKVWRPVVIQKHQSIKIDPPVVVQKPQKKMDTLPPVPAKPKEEIKMPKPAAIDKSQLPQPKSFTWHTVRRNESLEEIAQQYAVSVETIRKLNTFDTLSVGMRLKVKEI